MKLKKHIVSFSAVMLIALLTAFQALPVFAYDGEIPYTSYTYWESDGFTAVSAKAAYKTETVLTAERIGVEDFAEIADVCTDEAGNIYILDGKSSRIIILNSDYGVRGLISSVLNGEEKLKFENAKGIYVDKSGKIYIADTEHARVLVCDRDGECLNIITLPESKLIPDGFNYRPIKVTADSRGYVYVLSDGSYYGAILYSPKGEFYGFYGANSVEASVFTAISAVWDKLTSNNAKRAGKASRLPYQFTDLYADNSDFIYTATGKIPGSSQKSQIKRLSPGGKNILDSSDVVFGDKETASFKGETRTQNISGLAVDGDGYIYCYDEASGKIFMYDGECYMMTAFGGGGDGTQNGTFRQIAALDILDNGKKIIVADGLKLTLTVFGETDYGRELKEARRLTLDGDYTLSKTVWESILKEDSNCQLAYIGLSKAALADKDYRAAADYAKAGLDRELYSKAFNYNRKAFLKNNFNILMPVILLTVAAIVAVCIIIKKKKIVIVKSPKIRFALSAPFHPANVFSEVKAKNAGSVYVGVAIIALYYITSVLKATASGFLFRSSDNSFNSALVLVQTVGFVLLWTLANWAVATLLGGIGKLKEIFTVICYSIIPMVFGNAVYILFSYMLNADEGEFLIIFVTAMQLYSVLMVVIGSVIIHDVGIGRFLLITLLTLIGIVIIVFLFVLIVIFFQQAAAFAATLWREIFFR